VGHYSKKTLFENEFEIFYLRCTSLSFHVLYSFFFNNHGELITCKHTGIFGKYYGKIIKNCSNTHSSHIKFIAIRIDARTEQCVVRYGVVCCMVKREELSRFPKEQTQIIFF
jgi:hypothetical protein